MVEFNLLSTTPKSIRNIRQRKVSKSNRTIQISRNMEKIILMVIGNMAMEVTIMMER